MKANYERNKNIGIKNITEEREERKIRLDTLIWIAAIVVFTATTVTELFLTEKQGEKPLFTTVIEIIVWFGVFVYYAFFSNTRPSPFGKGVITAFALWPIAAIIAGDKLSIILLIAFLIISFVVYLKLYLGKNKKSTGITAVMLVSAMLLILSIYNYTFANGTPKSFFAVSVIAVIAAIICITVLLIKHILPERAAEEWYDKLALTALCGVFAFVLTYSACSNLNYILDFKHPEMTTIVIENKDIKHGFRTATRFVFCSTVDGKEYEFDVNSEDYINYQIGDTYEVELHKGAFNEEYYY